MTLFKVIKAKLHLKSNHHSGDNHSTKHTNKARQSAGLGGKSSKIAQLRHTATEAQDNGVSLRYSDLSQLIENSLFSQETKHLYDEDGAMTTFATQEYDSLSTLVDPGDVAFRRHSYPSPNVNKSSFVGIGDGQQQHQHRHRARPASVVYRAQIFSPLTPIKESEELLQSKNNFNTSHLFSPSSSNTTASTLSPRKTPQNTIDLLAFHPDSYNTPTATTTTTAASPTTHNSLPFALFGDSQFISMTSIKFSSASNSKFTPNSHNNNTYEHRSRQRSHSSSPPPPPFETETTDPMPPPTPKDPPPPPPNSGSFKSNGSTNSPLPPPRLFDHDRDSDVLSIDDEVVLS